MAIEAAAAGVVSLVGHDELVATLEGSKIPRDLPPTGSLHNVFSDLIEDGLNIKTRRWDPLRKCRCKWSILAGTWH